MCIYVYIYIYIYIYIYYIYIYTFIIQHSPVGGGVALGAFPRTQIGLQDVGAVDDHLRVEQKRSAGRQLGGGDDDFDYEASLRRCSLCIRVSGFFCCRVRVRVTC